MVHALSAPQQLAGVALCLQPGFSSVWGAFGEFRQQLALKGRCVPVRGVGAVTPSAVEATRGMLQAFLLTEKVKEFWLSKVSNVTVEK